TGSDELAATAKRLRNYGQSERYHHPELGLNSRLDELQAALLLVRLKWLNDFTARRRRIAERYFSEIKNSAVACMAPPQSAENHVYHLFVLLCDPRDRLGQHLSQRGVQSLIHYPVPAHHQKPCAGLRRDPKGLTFAERHASRCLSIPCHPQMPDADVAH